MLGKVELYNFNNTAKVQNTNRKSYNSSIYPIYPMAGIGTEKDKVSFKSIGDIGGYAELHQKYSEQRELTALDSVAKALWEAPGNIVKAITGWKQQIGDTTPIKQADIPTPEEVAETAEMLTRLNMMM